MELISLLGMREGLLDALLETDRKANCPHDWQPDPRGGYSCRHCSSQASMLFTVPFKPRQ